MKLYSSHIREKIGFSCSSWIGPCELTYEIVSKDDRPVEIVSCYLKNYRWVLYMRDYDHDGRVESLTIVKDLQPFMISRSKSGCVTYDKKTFTSKQAREKLTLADQVWCQAISLLSVRKHIMQYPYSYA